MTPRERVLAAIAGQETDRLPYIAWHHFHLVPPAGPNSQMAQAELRFYDSFQPDLLKVMHDVGYEQLGDIQHPGDWRSIPVIEPDAGNFADQLYTIRKVRKSLDPGVPMIDTVFGVYYYANEISKGKLLDHLREDPESVSVGLTAIAKSLQRYVPATLAAGCEGVYYALSGASGGKATREEYKQYFKEHDHAILSSAGQAKINILHLHGYEGLYFDLVHDLPANVVCWSDRAGGPSLTEARRIHSGCIMGGIDEKRFEQMSTQEIVAQGRAAIAEAGRRHFILAPGCSVPDNASVARLQAIRTAVSGDE